MVPDSDAASQVPDVPGLLKYTKDKKKLYLRSNETWKIIAPEKKVPYFQRKNTAIFYTNPQTDYHT